MLIWRFLVYIFHSLVSRLFAWRLDRRKEPVSISAKRRELINTLEHNVHVLELGAGAGGTLSAGAYGGSAGRFARLILSEPDKGLRERMAAKIAGQASGVEAGHLDILDAALPVLPFEDDELDAVILFFVASHVEDRAAAAAEVARILRPGGKLLFMDHGAHEAGHTHSPSHGQAHRTSVQQSGKSQQEQGHQSHGGNTNSRGKGDRRKAETKPFFFEWFRFQRRRHQGHELSLPRVLKEFREEERLEEMFQTTMEVDFFFKEITYGVFVKRYDIDG